MEEINSQVVEASSIDPAYIRTHIKELECETWKILTNAKPTTITISRLDEAGFFVPMEIIDISKYVARSSFEAELFEVEIEYAFVYIVWIYMVSLPFWYRTHAIIIAWSFIQYSLTAIRVRHTVDCCHLCISTYVFTVESRPFYDSFTHNNPPWYRGVRWVNYAPFYARQPAPFYRPTPSHSSHR